MISRRVAFLMLALALVLAPLGICLNDGMAVASPAPSSAMHHETSPSSDHHHDHDGEKSHFCSECEPPSFLKASKGSAVDIVPTNAVAPLPPRPIASLALSITRPDRRRDSSPLFHPPPPRANRVRLQI